MKCRKKIEADSTTKNTPVIMLTSSKENPDVEKSYNLEVNSSAVKPIDYKCFREIVNEPGIYRLLHNQTTC
jgi:two-component system response regulator